ncbi:posphoenolpyruvate synthetase regulatory kinase/phosphorylase PpsR [Pleionea litopenaei]|uniref:Putative phosphoenolpyruvate synthase regulatory protein n=1 Tax=Pleionea litopenaei TaxID=3070815 RepID=A0AA51RTZ8_9GAMM|nr:pyruvate, water dikinase regulatory protein [Pleionea sp. HL-JVS1]WMS87582.1 pyruvate, water dikinase regulatory protein [Pleionea sp. HL-JVS1]
MKRTVFFISDRTGITAEMLGQSLLSQFEEADFEKISLPFIDNEKKAIQAKEKIDTAAAKGEQPIVFDTIVTPEIRKIIMESKGLVLDFFHTFIGPLENALGLKSGFRVGKTHSYDEKGEYDSRIDAINFALNNDDGATTRYYDKAELILVGVSRCGKTPTSLYMAMQFGIHVANYPFTEEDMEDLKLPAMLKKYKDKLFGLTINAQRLHEIRTERRANSQYASLKQCQLEIREVEALMRKERIPYITTTSKSIEEIATKIMVKSGLKRISF